MADGACMSFDELYHFIFETYIGVGILVGVSLLLCIAIAAFLEMRTRKQFVDRGDEEQDEWSLFDDDDDEDDDEGENEDEGE